MGVWDWASRPARWMRLGFFFRLVLLCGENGLVGAPCEARGWHLPWLPAPVGCPKAL